MKKVIFASAVVLALIGCQQKQPATTTDVAPAAAPAAPATPAAPEAPAAAPAPAAPAGQVDKK